MMVPNHFIKPFKYKKVLKICDFKSNNPGFCEA